MTDEKTTKDGGQSKSFRLKWECSISLAAWAGGEARVGLGKGPDFSFCPDSVRHLSLAERQKETKKGRGRTEAEAARLVEEAIVHSGYTGAIEWKSRVHFVAGLPDLGISAFAEVDAVSLRWLVTDCEKVDLVGKSESLTQALSDAEAAAARLLSDRSTAEEKRRNHIAATVRDPVSDVRAA